MARSFELTVPDIGDFADIPVLEVFIQAGQTLAKDAPVVTLESDKATMEVPAPEAGVVKDVLVNVGDKVSQGTVLARMESPSGAEAAGASVAAEPAPRPESPPAAGPATAAATNGSGAAHRAEAATVELRVPDIGDFEAVSVIEVLVAVGDTIAKEAPLITLESDKASMEVPAEAAGTVTAVHVKVGDKVSQGTRVATLASGAPPIAAPAPALTPTTSQTQASLQRPAEPIPASYGAPGDVAASAAAATASPAPAAAEAVPPAPAAAAAAPPASAASTPPAQAPDAQKSVHASPSIRRFARELGVDLRRVTGTSQSGRISREDVQGFVKARLATETQPAPSLKASGFGLDLPPWPKVDFERFGETERRPLSRIARLSGPALARNWVFIPHVTNNDEADVTELEAFRKTVNAERRDAKVTLLAFLIKAVAATLAAFPEFNASLDGDALVLKRYYNIGFAADTPNGLVVPVLQAADRKGILAIAQETAALAAKARDGKISGAEMQGGTFTISSLGGIGGTSFSPIINAPEVAILGVSRSAMKPVWDGAAFAPRLMLPLSLSYDHRVIDGAKAARFLSYLSSALSDLRRTLL